MFQCSGQLYIILITTHAFLKLLCFVFFTFRENALEFFFPSQIILVMKQRVTRKLSQWNNYISLETTAQSRQLITKLISKPKQARLTIDIREKFQNTIEEPV